MGYRFRQICIPLAMLMVALWGFGCSQGGRGYRLRSLQADAEVLPTLAVRVYATADPNTADFFLTDLPREALRPGADLSGVTGHLVRVHMFLNPLAGSTPIASSAFNAAITHAVIADGRIGIYSGGGFLTPGATPGAASLGASLSGGTVRLEAATPGFVDLLGAAEVTAHFRAPRDDSFAAVCRARLDQFVKAAQPVGERPGP